MAQQKIQNVSEALERAKEQDQDVFLVSLNKEQLERTGFDTSTFGSFEYVDIYLQWDGDEFQIKYQFDGDPSQTYYFHEHETSKEDFMEMVEEYIALGGGEA
jgi:hypothetical protein